MEVPPNTLKVPQDPPDIALNLSDLTCNSPPIRKRKVDKHKRKWKKSVEHEKAYERAKARRAKQEQERDGSNCSTIVKLTKELIVPCHDSSVDSPPVTDGTDPLEKEETPTKNLLEMSNSLVDPEELSLDIPNEKESHKVVEVLDSSRDGQLYSPEEQDYYAFHKQMYAPQEQDYLAFLEGLEGKDGDAASREREFAEWLSDKKDNDIQPIPPETSPEGIREKAPPKRVAFSKETTVRFFSRTREELLQLRKRYKKTIGREAPDDDSDEEDWPIFKHLDEMLKEMEESNAWDDPMAAVTDMFVSKEFKKKMSPIMCVSCQDPTGNAPNDDDSEVNRSLADLDDEDELEPAMALAATKVAAGVVVNNESERPLSFRTQESNGSGIPGLGFAVPYKPPNSATPKKSEKYVRVISPFDGSPGTDKSSSTDEQSSVSSPPRLKRLLPSTDPPEETAATSSFSADPDAPKKASLSWLAEDLDSHEEGGVSVLSADPLNDSAISDGKNTSVSSLGRNTNSSLLRRVSDHLNTSVKSSATTSTSSSGKMGADANSTSSSRESTSGVGRLFDPPGSSVRTESTTPASNVHSVSVSVSELDDIILASGAKSGTSLLGQKAASEASCPTGDGIDSLVSSDSSSPSKIPSVDKKKSVVEAAKRWSTKSNSSQESSSQNASALTSSTASRSSTGVSSYASIAERKRQLVNGAKRWAALQKASSNNADIEIISGAPDRDELMRGKEDEPRPSSDANETVDSSVWDGVTPSPVTVPDETDLDEWHAPSDEGEIVFDHSATKDTSASPSDEGEIVFDHSATKDTSASGDSNPWLAAEAGPNLDETKPWNAFVDHPDVTATTCGSMSQDNASSEEVEEWVAFPKEPSMAAPSLDEAWEAFPEASQPQAVVPSTKAPSPRKYVRARPSKSSRVKALASKFERRRRTPSPGGYNVNPLTPSTPWADSDRAKDEYSDLQQPVLLDESRSSSDGSPVSVTLMP